MLIRGDARAIPLADGCVQTVVTSPPYWGLRDYGIPGQLGLEKTPQEYVEAMVQVFREVWRVLKPDGTVWINLGDSYQGGNRGGYSRERSGVSKNMGTAHDFQGAPNRCPIEGLKTKDLVGIPWRVAFALQADGWYLRSDIIWSKSNPMPESVTDRPTKAHEYIFLLSKSERYYFDTEAVRLPPAESSLGRWAQNIDDQKGSYRVPGKTNGTMKAVGGPRADKQRGHSRRHAGFNGRWDSMPREEQQSFGANIRTVWHIATRPYSGAHFATFPEAIPERCIKAGSKPGDLVLDPFGGSGTTGRVAEKLNRKWICLDLKYHELSSQRTVRVQKELYA